VNDSKNAFRTFILFTKAVKPLNIHKSFVNADERNCSRTFTSVHERALPPFVIPANAGTHPSVRHGKERVGSRFRGNDNSRNDDLHGKKSKSVASQADFSTKTRARCATLVASVARLVPSPERDGRTHVPCQPSYPSPVGRGLG
jgi:hypothetical protein